jgi:hypothetical protein
MAAVGSNSDPLSTTDPTVASGGFTIGAADVQMSTYFNSGHARRIYACAAGNIAVKRTLDASFVVYAVLQGAIIEGQIKTIGSTGNGSTAIAVVVEGS